MGAFRAGGRKEERVWVQRMALGLFPLLLVYPLLPLKAQEPPRSSGMYAMPASPFPADRDSLQLVPVQREGVVEQTEGPSLVQVTDMEHGELALVTGRSHVLRLQRNISRISISNPGIVDAVVLSPREVLLNARAQGSANIMLWDSLHEVMKLNVVVTPNPRGLYDVLKQIAPEGEFEVYSSGEVFVVKGEVGTVAQQREIESAANAFAAGSISLVTLKQPKQILLKIRFVEINHSTGFDFGIDLEHQKMTAGSNVIAQRFLPGGTGAETTGESRVKWNSEFVNTSEDFDIEVFDRSDEILYQFTRAGWSSHMKGFLKAIESEGLGKIIARPNLLTSDGEEASFLVGGEAAVVTVSAQDVNVEYREFGTRLTFTPEILSDERIRLSVAPEVSALDFASGVTVSGIVIPSFSTVRTETVVELRDGETFMIGGLLQQKVTESNTGAPFLRGLPLIGKLFDNISKTTEDTELLVMITPVFVEALKEEMDGETLELLETATRFHPAKRSLDPQQKAVRELLGDKLSELAQKAEERQIKEPAVFEMEAPELHEKAERTVEVEVAAEPGEAVLDDLETLLAAL